jgi:hypothetical protein
MSGKEICICAAIVTMDGKIIRGHRHRDCFHAALRRGKKISKHFGDQGFITSCNRYVDREEGYKLQKKAGAKSKNPEGEMPGWLFSEDLY